jgi:hypothetical protein
VAPHGYFILYTSFAIVTLFIWYSVANIQLVFGIRLFGDKPFGCLADFYSVVWPICKALSAVVLLMASGMRRGL